MEPTRLSGGASSAGNATKNIRSVAPKPANNADGYKGLFTGFFEAAKPGSASRFSGPAFLSIAALCVPLVGGSAGAAEASGANASTNSSAATISIEDFRKVLDEVQALRNQVKELNSELSTVRSSITNTAAPLVNKDEVKQLQDEVQALKIANETNSAAIKAVSANAATKDDVGALRDIEDEQTLRSIGSSSSISSYTVNGYQHLVNLTGYGILGYTSVIGPSQATTWESFKLSGIGLTLSGYMRNDPSRDGDVRFNLGLIGSPTKYQTGFTATPTYGYVQGTNSKPVKVITGLSTSSTSTSGTYVNAGDIWLAYDVRTTKLELEPTWTMSLQLGQFLTPYGLENPSTENNRPTINKAQYISFLGFGRDLGFIATGGLFNRNDPISTTIPVINYTIGVFDGAGINAIQDNNNGVDFLARLVYTPFYKYSGTFRNLAFGGNWYEGNLGPSTGQLPTKRRYGLDVSWLRKPFLLTGEWVHSEDGFDGRSVSPLSNFSTVSPTASVANSDSFVGTLFWTPSTLPDFQPWIRFDRWQPSAFSNYTPSALEAANIAGIGNLGRNVYSIGFNWFIWQVEPVTRRSYSTVQTERVLKLQVGYSYIDQTAYTGAKNEIDALMTFNF